MAETVQIKPFNPGEPLDVTSLNSMLTEVKANRGLLDQTKTTLKNIEDNNKNVQKIAKSLSGVVDGGTAKELTNTWSASITVPFNTTLPEVPTAVVTPVYSASDTGIDIRVRSISTTNFVFDARTTSKGIKANVKFYWLAVAQQVV